MEAAADLGGSRSPWESMALGGGGRVGAVSPISRRMLWLWKGGFIGKVEAEMV